MTYLRTRHLQGRDENVFTLTPNEMGRRLREQRKAESVSVTAMA